jgi:hypothetical protein
VLLRAFAQQIIDKLLRLVGLIGRRQDTRARDVDERAQVGVAEVVVANRKALALFGQVAVEVVVVDEPKSISPRSRASSCELLSV